MSDSPSAAAPVLTLIACARFAPGLLAMAAIGAAALLLAAVEERALAQPLIEALVLALLLGVALRNVARPLWVTVLNPGATLASRQILEVGVALLGASVSFPALLVAGPALLVLVLGGVAGTLGYRFWPRPLPRSACQTLGPGRGRGTQRSALG